MNNIATNESKKNLICYVSDDGYFLPSIFSALSCREYCSPEEASIIIFTVDIEPGRVKKFSDTLSRHGIKFVELNPIWRGQYNDRLFRQSYVSDASLGLFFINEYTEDCYEKFLYVDGDTLFEASPLPLFLTITSDSGVGAVADVVSFYNHHESAGGRDARKYLSSISHPEGSIYFNSGVLAANRGNFSKMSELAFSYFLAKTDLCHHYDQTAINSSCRDLMRPLPLSWNWQSYYKYVGLPEKIDICIRHFNGEYKPWNASYWPNTDYSNIYVRLAQKLSRIVGESIKISPTYSPYRSLRNLGKTFKLRTMEKSQLGLTVGSIIDYETAAQRDFKKRVSM